MVGFGNVAAERRAIEMTYTDSAEVLRANPKVGSDKITRSEMMTVISSVRCALSNGQNASVQGNAQMVDHDAVLFVPPDTDIRAGDIVCVTRYGTLRRFGVLGNPNDYATHREVKLEERDLA